MTLFQSSKLCPGLTHFPVQLMRTNLTSGLMAHHSHLSVICQLSQCTKSNQFAYWICCPVFHQLTQTKDELIPHRRASIDSLARPLAGDYPILSCYSSSNIGTLPLVREGSSGSTSTSSSGWRTRSHYSSSILTTDCSWIGSASPSLRYFAGAHGSSAPSSISQSVSVPKYFSISF